MGYKVIFLDGLDGRPFVECEVCKRIERNVIEPVSLFVKEEDFESIDKQLKNLPKDKVDEVVGKFIKETNKLLAQSEARCIFHCEKENEVWMENIEEYQKYRQRQKDKLMKRQPFNEESPARWRGNLVDKFWQRIRAYRFVVDYFGVVDDETPYPNNKLVSDLIEFYMKKLENRLGKRPSAVDYLAVNSVFPSIAEKKDNSKEYIFDFRKMIFPNFQNVLLDKPCDTNFWYNKERSQFSKQVTFSKSCFCGVVDFSYIRFKEQSDFSSVFFKNIVDFSGVKFFQQVYFSLSRFWSDTQFKMSEFRGFAHFWKVRFYNNIEFILAKFFNVALFREAQFWQKVNFNMAELKENGIFYEIECWERIDFEAIKLEKDCFFSIVGDNKYFNFSKVKCGSLSQSYIEIRNLKTERLIINKFTNYANEFLFFDLELLPSEKSDEPNLEIKNSILNKMRFINCDFSNGEKIKIEDSSIASCEFVNVKWGKISEERICPELFENEPSKAQDIYRQLKLAHDNQKDFIHGGDFYALEMRAYDKYLDSLSWLEHFKDKIVFKISKFASNYAQNWWLVLKWIYSIVIAMTVLVYIDSSRITFGNNYLEILLFTILLAVNLVIFSKKARWWFKFLFLMCYFFFLNFLAYSNFDIRLFFDDFFITLGKSLYPIKTVLNGDKNHQHILLYKTFFGISWIALSYLIYQLIVSLRRKIRR